METKELRRIRLREWFEGKTLPAQDKSYISQIVNGKSGLGEKGAKRLERDYNMPPGYLVNPEEIESGDNFSFAGKYSPGKNTLFSAQCRQVHGQRL